MPFTNRHGLFNRRSADPLDNFKMNDLKIESVRLQNNIRKIKEDLKILNTKNQRSFDNGCDSGDTITKIMAATEMKQYDREAKHLFAQFCNLYKRYTFVSNLIILKKNKESIADSPVWSQIKSLSPEKFERTIIATQINEEECNSILDGLNAGIENQDKIGEILTADPETQEIIGLMGKVATGEVDRETAKHNISIENNIPNPTSKEL